MKFEELESLIQNLNTWNRGAQRAPHKPLLILYAFGKCVAGSDRMIPYKDVDHYLRNLLINFGPPRKSFHPEYPFWRLQNDGLWELNNTDNIILRHGSTDAKKSELINHNVHGGFPKEIYDLLLENPGFVHNLANQLLETHFPPSMHQDILDAVGLVFPVLKINRDPTFRDKILRAYEYRCSVCGLDMRLDNITFCLDAAHIKWRQANGPDREDNGLALCVLHHRMFDRGAFTLDNHLQLLVSQSISGSVGINELLLFFHKKPIRKPQSESYYPNPLYINWHQAEVFRKPARD